MKITLAYPQPTRDSATKLTCLSILYPGMLFEAQGHEVYYWDQRYDEPGLLDEYIQRSDKFGTSAFTGLQCGEAALLLKHAKAIKPSITTMLGGYHARLLPDQVRQEPFVDEVWAERTYGEHLPVYHPHTRKHFARGDVQFYTSRGCPFPCTFCALRSPWEPKSIESLERELKDMHNDLGFTEISFSDPNIGFGVYKDDEGATVRLDRVKRMKAIGQIMRDIGVNWDSNIRSPYLTPEMIDVLSWGRCTSIEIGCESGNSFYLRKIIKKGHDVDSIRNAAINVKGSGISVMYSFLCNGPYETRAMKNDTCDLIDWIVETDPLARVSLYSYACYPGSPLADMAMKGEGCGGEYACKKFDAPSTMEGWGALRLMLSPEYWVGGLSFRADASRANFKGEEWALIEPYIKLANQKWKARDFEGFPCEEVEKLIEGQVMKSNKVIAESFQMSGV